VVVGLNAYPLFSEISINGQSVAQGILQGGIVGGAAGAIIWGYQNRSQIGQFIKRIGNGIAGIGSPSSIDSATGAPDDQQSLSNTKISYGKMSVIGVEPDLPASDSPAPSLAETGPDGVKYVPEDLSIDSPPQAVVNSFRNGEYVRAIVPHDMMAYRAEDGQGIGPYFGTTKPLNSMDAEELYNIKAFGNNATQVATYSIAQGTEVLIGPVNGGAGIQMWIPNPGSNPGIHLVDRAPLFTPETKYITPLPGR
jgi:hypothetical protein